MLYSSTTAATALIKFVPSGLVTVDISLYCLPSAPPPEDAKIIALSDAIAKTLKPRPDAAAAGPRDVNRGLGQKLFPPIVRDGAFDPYVPTTDGLLIQYDFDRLVLHERSLYQDVKILHSPQVGREGSNWCCRRPVRVT